MVVLLLEGFLLPFLLPINTSPEAHVSSRYLYTREWISYEA